MEKEENKENSVAGGKEKEVIDLSLDEESASVSNEGINYGSVFVIM